VTVRRRPGQTRRAANCEAPNNRKGYRVKLVRMNTFSKLGLRVMSGAVVLVGLAVAAQAQLTLDNFESYTNHEVLATAASASVSGSPWGRFGAATSANPVALTGTGTVGSVGMDYALNYSGGNNASLEYFFSTVPTDLSSDTALSVDLRVSAALTSNTIVEIAEEQTGGQIYQTTATFALVLTNTTYQTFTLALVAADMSNQGTAGAFDLTQVKDLRIRFQNVTAGGAQHVFVDNFEAIPEPSTLGLIGLGLSLSVFVIRRRRS
jgi:hypothetical protein